MLEWLRLIGEFFLNRITAVFEIFSMLFQSVGLFKSAFMLAPSFLYPILIGTFAVIIVMWVVNLL